MAQAKPFSDLIKAVNKEPERRTLQYKGETYEYWATVLTMAQREAIKRIQKNENDANEFAVRLLISKALFKDGKRMFQDAQYAEMKNEWPVAEVEEAMLKLLKSDADRDAEESDEEGNTGAGSSASRPST